MALDAKENTLNASPSSLNNIGCIAIPIDHTPTQSVHQMKSYIDSPLVKQHRCHHHPIVSVNFRSLWSLFIRVRAFSKSRNQVQRRHNFHSQYRYKSTEHQFVTFIRHTKEPCAHIEVSVCVCVCVCMSVCSTRKEIVAGKEKYRQWEYNHHD